MRLAVLLSTRRIGLLLELAGNPVLLFGSSSDSLSLFNPRIKRDARRLFFFLFIVITSERRGTGIAHPNEKEMSSWDRINERAFFIKKLRRKEIGKER